MQKGIGLGELIIGEGAVRDDGLTKKYVPGNYPAVPSFKLMALAHKYAPKAVYGIIRSHDGFYMDDNAEWKLYRSLIMSSYTKETLRRGLMIWLTGMTS